MAIKIVDGFIWLSKKSGRGGKFVGKLLAVLAKYSVLPIVLIIYKYLLLIKIKVKNFDITDVNYLTFIKKVLPRLAVAVILLGVATNNLMAAHYSTDEYVNRTLLSAVVDSDEAQWSELVEERGPADTTPVATSYLDDSGTLQELAIATPFEDNFAAIDANVTADSSSLAVAAPGETNSSVDVQGNRTEAIEYVVQEGDVLGFIAEKFGVSVNTILWENNLSFTSTIRPGDTLTILPNSGINHEVASGDTVLSIAQKYQVEANDIVSANKLADAGDIRSGDLLFIPNGVKPTRVVSSYQPRTTTVAPTPVDSTAPFIDSGTKLQWPLISNQITQYYHWQHHAVDIGDKTGNPIYAAEAGRVTKSGWSNGYGYNVVINHGNGIETLYAHSSKLLVEVGDTVSRGETIALIGSTGWSTGPHLHFEVRVNGSKVNPLNYIR